MSVQDNLNDGHVMNVGDWVCQGEKDDRIHDVEERFEVMCARAQDGK